MVLISHNLNYDHLMVLSEFGSLRDIGDRHRFLGASPRLKQPQGSAALLRKRCIIDVEILSLLLKTGLLNQKWAHLD